MNKIIIANLFFFLPLFAFCNQTLRIAHPEGAEKLLAVQQLMSLISSALGDVGYQPEFVGIPLKRSLELTAKGEIDGVVNDDLIIQEGRDKLISTSFPLIFANIKVFYRKDNKAFDYNHLEKFTGAIALNNAAIEDLAIKRSLKYITTKTLQQNLHLVASGRVDYVIGFERIWLESIVKEGLADKIQMSPEVFAKIPIYFTMSAIHAKKFPEIEMALKKRLKKDAGRYSELKYIINSKAATK